MCWYRRVTPQKVTALSNGSLERLSNGSLERLSRTAGAGRGGCCPCCPLLPLLRTRLLARLLISSKHPHAHFCFAPRHQSLQANEEQLQIGWIGLPPNQQRGQWYRTGQLLCYYNFLLDIFCLTYPYPTLPTRQVPHRPVADGLEHAPQLPRALRGGIARGRLRQQRHHPRRRGRGQDPSFNFNFNFTEAPGRGRRGGGHLRRRLRRHLPAAHLQPRVLPALLGTRLRHQVGGERAVSG
jgi:hypothetical protein